MTDIWVAASDTDFQARYSQFDPEMGWFETQAEAQAECDRINAKVVGWHAEHVEQINAKNTTIQREYNRAMADYEVLKKAKRRPAKPGKPYRYEPTSFDTWVSEQGYQFFEPVKLSKSEGSHA